MADPRRIIDITLSQGECFFGSGAIRIHTLLGSCVAITLWHPERRTGGMCHYLLPSRGSRQQLSAGYYADEVIAYFMRMIKRSGTHPGEYEVKLFGGGSMLDNPDKYIGAFNVSDVNIQQGTQMLLQNGFAIKATDLGGNDYRKLFLDLGNGDVWVKHGRHQRTFKECG